MPLLEVALDAAVASHGDCSPRGALCAADAIHVAVSSAAKSLCGATRCLRLLYCSTKSGQVYTGCNSQKTLARSAADDGPRERTSVRLLVQLSVLLPTGDLPSVVLLRAELYHRRWRQTPLLVAES